MKNRVAYFLYYVKYHKRKCVATGVNAMLLITALVGNAMDVSHMSFKGEDGIHWATVGAFVVIVLNLLWSLYDDFLAEVFENRGVRLGINPSLDIVDELVFDEQDEKSVEVGVQRACFRPDVNSMLIRETGLRIEEDENVPKDITKFIRKHREDLFAFLRKRYKESNSEHKMFFNEKKLCLTYSLQGNMTSEKSVAKIHKGCYYDTFLTNICSTKKLENNTENIVLYDGKLHYPHAGKKLKPLEISHMNNEIGISTIAFTNDNNIVIWESNERAQIQGHQLVPSGSGSADWKDREGKKTLSEVICYSMERELKEECSLLQYAESQEKKISETRIIGYWRWLNKGGKPEFCGVTKLDCGITQIHENEEEVCERDEGNYSLSDFGLDADGIVAFVDMMLAKNKTKDGDSMSLPLYMNLLFLKQYILTEDLGHLDVEEQKKRVAFLLGE